MERRNAWKTYTQEQLKELDQINDRYKVCLDEGKTERECIRLTVKEIEKQGYRNLNDIKGSLKTGDKVYAVCMGKVLPCSGSEKNHWKWYEHTGSAY